MGLKKFLNKKFQPPSEETIEENRYNLNELGIATKSTKKKREKFAAYGAYARDKRQDKVYAPAGYEEYALPPDPRDKKNQPQVQPVEDTPGQKKGGLLRRNKNKNKQSNNDSNTEINQNPYGAPSAKDPYGINMNSSEDISDPYAINSNAYSSNTDSFGYSGNSFYQKHPNTKNYGLPPSASEIQGNPYQKSNTVSDFSDLDEYNGTTSSSIDRYDSGTSYNGNNYRESSMNPRQTDSPYSGLSRQTNSGSNPYSNTNEKVTYNNTSSLRGPPAGNPYGRRRNVNNEAMSRNKTNIAPSVYSMDLNKSSVDDNVSLAKSKTRASALYGRSDFNAVLAEEENRDSYDDVASALQGYETTGAQVQMERLDLNEPINDVALDEDLNATIEDDTTTVNNYGKMNYWQVEEEQDQEEEQEQNYGYGNFNSQRGYKTFDEIQQEEEERKQFEEEEEVHEIKKEIRFVKQSSVASTRNTLKMAQDAELSGMNTLGMLGNQSETLHNVETNLNLMKTQNIVANDRVSELKKLNRSILAVHISNPFNSKNRALAKEEEIKTQKMQDQMMRAEANGDLSTSTRRIEDAMNSHESSELQEKYQRRKILERNRKFQFENDEEDDEMELEIDRNLDKIGQISGRLKKIARAAGEELDSQQTRLKKIEEDTENLDLKINTNTIKLANIR